MTPKRRARVVVIVVAGGCVLILLTFLARGLLRWYSLQRILNSGYARERVSVEPKTQELAAMATVGPVNLGYATFDTGSTSPVKIRSQGDGATVLIVCDDVHVGFLPPFDPGDSNSLTAGTEAATTQEGRKYPQTTSYVQQMEADPLEAEMAMEATLILPFSKTLLMTKDDFLGYSLKLRQKGSFQRGLNEVYFFESALAKGIARIGDSTNDRRVASVVLTSLDGASCVGLHLGLVESSSRDIAAALNPILRSFHFTAESVEDRDKVKALILHAGIPHEDDSQPGVGANLDPAQ